MLGNLHDQSSHNPDTAATAAASLEQAVMQVEVCQLYDHLDDLGSSIGDDTCHLHAVPARPFAHDIAVEAVQDALVSQLQGVIQHHHVCCLLHLDHVP